MVALLRPSGPGPFDCGAPVTISSDILGGGSAVGATVVGNRESCRAPLGYLLPSYKDALSLGEAVSEPSFCFNGPCTGFLKV